MSRGAGAQFSHLPAWKHGLALAYVDELASIFADTVIERVEQDAQWGGPPTDDQRDIAEWSEYIHKQLSKLFDEQADNKAIRQRFVKVAALAFAAIASMDRVVVPEQKEDDEGCGQCPACLLKKFLQAEGHSPDVQVLQVDNMADLFDLLSGLRRPKGHGRG